MALLNNDLEKNIIDKVDKFDTRVYYTKKEKKEMAIQLTSVNYWSVSKPIWEETTVPTVNQIFKEKDMMKLKCGF